MREYTLTEIMGKADPLFMGKALIPKQPSTKVRDREKRDRVLAIEVKMIKELTKDIEFEKVGTRREVPKGNRRLSLPDVVQSDRVRGG